MKYRVPVIITARDEYTVEVEASDARKAEEKAINQWREQTSPDFQVADFYSAEAEAEQLTWECEEVACGKEISRDEWLVGGGYCIKCAAEYEA